MNVLYYAAGLLLGVSVTANLLTQENAWGILILPSIGATIIAVILEYNR